MWAVSVQLKTPGIFKVAAELHPPPLRVNSKESKCLQMFTKNFYKYRHNSIRLSGLMLTNAPENNRVSKEKR